MDITRDLIDVLSSSEQQGFISYLNKRNKRKDTRNVSLFNHYISDSKKDLKQQLGANAYNVLKKRLTDNLIDYLSASTIEQESSEEINVIRHLVLSRRLFAHSKSKAAYKLLQRAEVMAEKINQYSLLNEIYQTAMQYSFNLPNDEYERIITNFEANRNELVEQSKLTMAFSVIHRAYIRVENEGGSVDLEKLLLEVYDRFNISDERGYNFMSLYQLAQLADLSGAASKQYHSVDLFFLSKADELEGTALDTEKHLIYHIDLLYLVANIFFRKHDFKNALLYLGKMKKQMDRSNKRYYKDKVAQYLTLRAICLNYSGKWRSALMYLDSLLMASDIEAKSLLNTKLAKLMIHLQQGQLEKAKKMAPEFSKTDLWYERRMGMEWLLKKNFAEIILHYELENIDYLDSRIQSLKRKLKQDNLANLDERIRIFLRLLEELSKTPTKISSSKFKEKVARSMEWKPREEEDIFMMSFYAWLKAKLNQQQVYESTLEMFK